MTPIAAALLNLKKLNAVIYVYTGTVCVELYGPPLVIVYTKSNLLNVQMISSKMVVNLNELPETPSSQMQALAFAVQELALYLDTHRDDREALELYRRYQQLLEKVRAEYQKRFGPLNHGTPQTSESYQWLDDPWPWEYTTNKEA